MSFSSLAAQARAEVVSASGAGPMSIVKRLVCLANSRKPRGTCVAGKVLGDGAPWWLRPISTRPEAAVSEQERCYADGGEPRVLDVIDVALKGPQPNAFQSENWLLDPSRRWARRGRKPWKALRSLVDDPVTLWVNASSTYHGRHDRVAVADAEQLDNSLYLLGLSSLELRVFAPGEAFGNPQLRVQACFVHRSVAYWLRVTDPVVEGKYLSQPGTHTVGPCFVTVSLGEAFEGYCYKLVAAVITPDSGGDAGSS